MFVSGSTYFRESHVESIVVGQGGAHPYATELAKAGYRIEQIPPVRTIFGFIAFRRLIRRLMPDVVHIHTEGAFAFSVLAALDPSRQRPVIRTVHNVFKGNIRAQAGRKLQAKAVDRWVSSFIVPSPDVEANEIAFGRSPNLIYNWVDDVYFELQRKREQQAEHQKRPSIIMVGNASRIKNHEMVLKVIRNLPIDLYFHGEESNATESERRILDELESEGRLLHRGVGDPGPSLVKATLFAMPSKQEGMPVSLAEALTVGLPAFVNDVPGLRWASAVGGVEIVRDEADAWAAALGRLLTEAERLKRLPEVVVDFSARRGVSEYVSLYRELLQSNAYQTSENK